MEQQQSTLSWKTVKKEKKKVKGRKNKVGKEISSSDDDDIPVIHQVCFVYFEVFRSPKRFAFYSFSKHHL